VALDWSFSPEGDGAMGAATAASLWLRLPIVFVCHSYGGLLVKQLLRSGSEIATEYEVLVERVAGIVFLGTPNQGSSIAHYAKALGPILRTSPLAAVWRAAPE
jgi:triacylglycerol esterase/lipase EstA (alpha/beta hydrolase family)